MFSLPASFAGLVIALVGARYFTWLLRRVQNYAAAPEVPTTGTAL